MTDRLRAAAVVAVLATALLGAHGAAQRRRPAVTTARFLALLTEYRTGNADAAVKELASWSEQTVQVEALLPPSMEDARTRAAFVGLVTEAAIQSDTFGKFRAGTPTVLFLGGWGLEDVFEPMAYRAFRQIKALTETARAAHDEVLLSFVRNWYVLTISYCVRTDRFDAESGLWDIADHEFRDEPDMRLLLGAVGEAKAGPVQPTFRFDCPWPEWLHGPHGCLHQADVQEARWGFKGALKDDPPSLEAGLRLGRVEHLMGEDADARAHLEKALAEAKAARHAFVTYMAGLFLGELNEEAGDLPAAIACYRDAVNAEPSAHTGLLALGQALVRSGDDSGWVVMRQMFEGESLDHPAVEDPWIVYRWAQAWQQADRLQAMRAWIRR